MECNIQAFHCPSSPYQHDRASKKKSMIALYVEDNHKIWDKYIPEFRFALNSAVQETTGVELQLGRKLKSPMDKLLQKGAPIPDSPPYDIVHHVKQLYAKAKESGEKARKQQLRNYNRAKLILNQRTE